MKSLEEIKKVSYEVPEMEVLDFRFEKRILDGTIEQGQGCTDDECPKDY